MKNFFNMRTFLIFALLTVFASCKAKLEQTHATTKMLVNQETDQVFGLAQRIAPGNNESERPSFVYIALICNSLTDYQRKASFYQTVQNLDEYSDNKNPGNHPNSCSLAIANEITQRSIRAALQIITSEQSEPGWVYLAWIGSTTWGGAKIGTATGTLAGGIGGAGVGAAPGAVIGGVIGGFAGFITGVWSMRSHYQWRNEYSFRSKRELHSPQTLSNVAPASFSGTTSIIIRTLNEVQSEASTASADYLLR